LRCAYPGYDFAKLGRKKLRRENAFSCVIAGLDPAIHAEVKHDWICREGLLGCRSAWTTGSSPVVTKKSASRERICVSTLPWRGKVVSAASGVG
jgi:hypothetical protein